MPSYLKVFLAFAAYAALHSALLTPSARLALEAVLGSRRFRAFFRLGYNLVASGLLVVLLGYASSLPDREILHLGGWMGWVLWGVRLGALAFIGHCVADLGTASFLGLAQVQAWLRGEEIPGDGVETGALEVAGPYRHVRHPMYAAALVALWAEPHWMANRLALILGATVYLLLGALHEERRLLRAHGEAYRRYAEQTPRFLPRLPGFR